MLKIDNLTIAYGETPIVRNVSLAVQPGEVTGIVGESGCGKTTLLQGILRLTPSAQITGGTIRFQGEELTTLPEEAFRKLRGSRLAMIFQQAAQTMDPLQTIGQQFYETARMHQEHVDRDACLQQASELMTKMRLEDTEGILRAYPFELSGGMCQRVAIAVAMSSQPEIILADEPTSALDVTAQAQVVAQLRGLKEDFGTAMLIVSHNIGMLTQLADTLAVMYSGEIVEWGRTEELVRTPAHPYTKALFAAVPKLNGDIQAGIEGRPPEFDDTITGCRFAERCPACVEACIAKAPDTIALSATHWVRCSQQGGNNHGVA